MLTQAVASLAEERGQRSADEFRHHLLWCASGGRPEVVGVVALRAGAAARALHFHLLQAVAEGLRGPEPGSPSTAQR